MKKLKNEKRYVRLQIKRDKKRRRRLRKNSVYKNPDKTINKITKFKIKHDNFKISKFNFELNDFLNEKGNEPNKKLTTKITIPEIFSLEEKYDETILTLSLIRKSLLKFYGNKFYISFKNCKKVGFSSLFLFKVLLDEYLKELKKLDKKLEIYKAYPDIKIQHSVSIDVNLKLYANDIIKNVTTEESDFIPISNLNMIIGRKAQKHYRENKKGYAATRLRNYINESLKRHGFELNPKGTGFLDGLIAEILNNAEDHSIFDTWYAFANLFENRKTSPDCEVVGELNLGFLNFGHSIFEGFEDTKIQNKDVYNEMEELYNQVTNFGRKTDFTKENLFTLYALQEGYSRLKFSQESRGTGTMKFIQSFLNLGDYEDKEKKYIPELLIYSGNTVLKCDNTYKPFEIDNVNYLSLNKENNLSIAPEKSHIKNIENRFPGTLFISKIYLNENHLKNKFNNGK